MNISSPDFLLSRAASRRSIVEYNFKFISLITFFVLFPLRSRSPPISIDFNIILYQARQKRERRALWGGWGGLFLPAQTSP
jgi:hypothetical protein